MFGLYFNGIQYYLLYTLMDFFMMYFLTHMKMSNWLQAPPPHLHSLVELRIDDNNKA